VVVVVERKGREGEEEEEEGEEEQRRRGVEGKRMGWLRGKLFLGCRLPSTTFPPGHVVNNSLAEK
jgi:hypothetical protein